MRKWSVHFANFISAFAKLSKNTRSFFSKFFGKQKTKETFCSTRECISFVVWLGLSIHPVCAFLFGIKDQPMVAAVRWPPQTNTSLSFSSLSSLPRLPLCLSFASPNLMVKKLANGWTYVEMVDPPRRVFPECGGRDL